MKERNKGLFVVILGILICLLIYNVAECEEYQVPNFIGGLNLALDSTNLRPNEALVMSNFSLDVPNVLTARQGYSYWDSVAFGSSEIDEIFVYEPYVNTFRMVVASGGFFYITDSLGINGDITWDTMRVGQTGDSVAVANSDSIIHNAVSYDYWYAWVAAGDSIDFDGVGGAEYGILEMSYSEDTIIYLTSDYLGFTDTLEEYTVYKTYSGSPFMKQYRSNLYLGSSENFAITYNDTTYKHFSLIDTGTVSTTYDASDTVVLYNRGQVHFSYPGYFTGNEDAFFEDSSGVDIGDYLFFYYYNGADPTVRQTFQSVIQDTLWGNNALVTTDILPFTQIDTWNDYAIKANNYSCVNNDSGQFISDPSKHWLDLELGGDSFLNNCYAIDGTDGFVSLYTIFCNQDSVFSVEGGGAFSVGDRYYIFMTVPYDLSHIIITPVDSVWKESKRYEDMLFNRNVMYGYGYDRAGERSGFTPYGNPFERFNNISKTNSHRIWYGHTLYPTYSQFDYNFDVNYNEDITSEFILRGDNYFGTEDGIWRSSGIPGMVTSSSSQTFTNVISSNGIPGKKYWAKATEEYGYFTNITGIYNFNGVRAQKISLRVDPLIKKNYASRIVMGYQDFRLYVSFPDSNFTLVYDERYDAFYTYDFGMTAFYAMPDTNIFYFGHSEKPGQVFYYPNGKYYNELSDQSETYSTTYESGYQDFGEYWKGKRVVNGFFPIRTLSTARVELYKDFETTPSDSITTNTTGFYVYRNEFDNDCWGEYFKVRITSDVDSSLTIKGYILEWLKTGDPIK